ncbi:MAG: pro-sigmaK processing inhibitor BofA family protein [Clostridiales bacterium]|nr:pro-sigmaK processing inhibitor BofA family protein [Clostridiales bacterium]
MRRVLGMLCRVALRTAVGGGVLAALAPFGGALGLHLGVNLGNALVIGVLGAPGLGLLLLNWLVR